MEPLSPEDFEALLRPRPKRDRGMRISNARGGRSRPGSPGVTDARLKRGRLSVDERAHPVPRHQEKGLPELSGRRLGRPVPELGGRRRLAPVAPTPEAPKARVHQL